MRLLHAACWFVLLPAIIASAGEPPTLQDGRPRIKKLGTIDVDKVENAPILFRGKLYRCEWYRNKGCFHFVEHDTGRTTPEFAQGWCFANAFVAGDTVYVTGSQHGPKVQMFVSQDLERWDTYTALDLPGHTIFNTSICKAGDRYVMMYEIGEPAEEAAHRSPPGLRHPRISGSGRSRRRSATTPRTATRPRTVYGIWTATSTISFSPLCPAATKCTWCGRKT